MRKHFAKCTLKIIVYYKEEYDTNEKILNKMNEMKIKIIQKSFSLYFFNYVPLKFIYMCRLLKTSTF